MILGEHAVVFGAPCLVTAVGQRLSVTIDESGSGIIIDAPQVKETKFVDAAITKFFTTSGKEIKDRSVKLTIRSEFSQRVGFGSSSAVSVATLKALSLYFKVRLTGREIFELAYRVTLDIQGVGSGFDIAAATYGGTLYFKKGGEAVEQLPDHLPLVIGYTGVKADTPTLVREVSSLREEYPEKVERIFQAIGKLVDQGRESIMTRDWQRLGTLMNFDQEYLRDLGVSTTKLEDLISAAKSAGAYGAKLSGAGGGDCMIALVPEDKKKAVRKAIKDAGGEVINVEPNAPGVRVETTDDQQETLVVVDKDDRVIGYKTRYECHHDKSLIHRTVGVLIYNDKGEILLQKRSLTKDMEPGLWGISSAGHVGQNQGSEEAVHREMSEELGIDLPVTFFKKFLVSDPQETEMAYLYKAQSNGSFRPDPKEVDSVQFFSPREIVFKAASGELKLTEAAKASLEAAEIL